MKILEIDIETAPTIGYLWGLFNQNVAIDQIVEPGYTLCFAYKWQHEQHIGFHSLWDDGEKRMAKAAWALLNEADAVVHYNGKKFDMPTLNRDFVRLGIEPPTSYHEIDLYQAVRRRFRFASNKLDFVCEQLGLGNKTKHKGMALWRDVMGGDERAQRKMRKYNIQDVRLLERLYYRIQPWIPNHPNRGLYVDNPRKPVCRSCGGTHIKLNGLETRFVQKYQRYRCLDCGANLRGRLSIGGRQNQNVLV